MQDRGGLDTFCAALGGRELVGDGRCDSQGGELTRPHSGYSGRLYLYCSRRDAGC